MSEQLNPRSDESRLRDACDALEAFTLGGTYGREQLPGLRNLISEEASAQIAYDIAFKDAYAANGNAKGPMERKQLSEDACIDERTALTDAAGRVEAHSKVCSNLRELISGYRSLVASSREMARG